MIPVKHFYMIRHGQTEANAARVMAGSLDSPLTAQGIAQAAHARDIVAALPTPPRLIIHSHLSRARDTANIINQAVGAPMHEDRDYAEMHAGDWEGASYDTVQEIFRSWVNPPNGETCQMFFDRVRRAKTGALTRHEPPVLVVCHGGVFRAFWKLYGIHSEGVKNCMLYEFTPKENPELFPWDIFRYEMDDLQNLNRCAVHMSSDNPTSEIA
jgi:broad specificity phosphatase PhoE